MKKQFQINKEGVTEGKTTILCTDSEREMKIKKYLELGYEVFDMEGNRIK